MYCSKCGNKIDDDSNFCPSCGEKITRKNNNKPQQDMQSKDENINQEKIDLNKKSTIKENDEEVSKEKIDLNKYNSNTNRAEKNKEQDEFQNEENRCMYGNKEFEISAQKYTEGTEYETIITFNETDIRIRKENKRGFRKYKQEYKFNINDVLYVTNTKHLSIFMMIFTVCATLACIYAFGIKVLFILIIDILLSIYRCLEIGFKNGDKINILFDGLFGKKDCTEIIEHMNRISEQRISNDKKYSQNVTAKNILSILAAIGIVFGLSIFTVLTEEGSTVKIDNPYKDENIKNLYQEINNSSIANEKEDNQKEEIAEKEEIKQEETKKPTEKIQEEEIEEKELSAEEAKALIEKEDSEYLKRVNGTIKIDSDDDIESLMGAWGIDIENETAYYFTNMDLSIPDCENGFYVVTAKSKKVYRGPHQGGVPMYLISNNNIVKEYQFIDQKPISNRIEGYWMNNVNYTISITPLYFNNMSYNIVQEIDDTTIISVNNGEYLETIAFVFDANNNSFAEVYVFNEISELYEDCGQFVKQDRY